MLCSHTTQALPTLGSVHDSLMKGIRFAFTGDNSSSSTAVESPFAPYRSLLAVAPEVSAAQTLLGCWQLLQAALEHLLRSVEADVVARGLKTHAAELDMSLSNAAAETDAKVRKWQDSYTFLAEEVAKRAHYSVSDAVADAESAEQYRYDSSSHSRAATPEAVNDNTGDSSSGSSSGLTQRAPKQAVSVQLLKALDERSSAAQLIAVDAAVAAAAAEPCPLCTERHVPYRFDISVLQPTIVVHCALCSSAF
jgi:hypothetical protein